MYKVRPAILQLGGGVFLIKHLAKNGGKAAPSPDFQKASVLPSLSAVSKRRELRSKIVKSEKRQNRYAVHLFKTAGLVFYSVYRKKNSQKAAIYGGPAFGKTHNVAFYGERAPG